MSLNCVGYIYADCFAISISENSSEICNELKKRADKSQSLEVLKKISYVMNAQNICWS